MFHFNLLLLLPDTDHIAERPTAAGFLLKSLAGQLDPPGQALYVPAVILSGL